MAIDITSLLFNVHQDQIDEGQGLNLDFIVKNLGDMDVDPFDLDIFLSTDNQITEDDYKLGTYEIVEGLKAGEDSGIKTYRYSTPAVDHPFWQGNQDYYVGILIDPDEKVAESDEANNGNQRLGTDTDVIKVVDYGPSDLVASSVSIGGQNFKPGGILPINFSIKNQSTTEFAYPFTVDIYLTTSDPTRFDPSDPTSFDPSKDFKLAFYDIRNALAPGTDTGIKSYTYNLPDLGNALWENGDGKYYIALDIDSKNEVAETNENNNSYQGEGLDYTGFDVTGVDSAADLVVTSFKALEENFKAGDTIDVEYEVTNQGGSAANLFAAGFYLFTQDYLANNDNLSVKDVPEVYFFQGDRDSSLINLQPGASTGKMTTQITIPEEWGGFSGPGDYYLGVEADVYDDVVESSDANNSLREEMVDYQKVTIDAPVNNTVDLVGTHFEVVQDQIVPGEYLDLGFTVKNEGLAKVDNFYFELYLSHDEHISADEDYYLGRYDIRDGLDGKSDTGLKSFRYQAPEADHPLWSKGDGPYYAGMIVDPKNLIAETNEDNNSNQEEEGKDYSQTSVTGLDPIADLKTNGSFQVMPEAINIGDTFEVQYDIFNEGTASADLFAAGFYLFREDYLLNNDELKIEDVPEVYFFQGDRDSSLISLDPDTGTGVVSTELTMPSDWEGFAEGNGEYYVGVAADPFNDIPESDESDNSLNGEFIDYAKVNVTGLGPLADLKTNGSFQVMPETINTGDTFEVQYDIFNEGPASADFFAAGFYLFKEDYLLNNDELKIEDVPEVYFFQGDRDSSLISLDSFSGTGVVSTELTMPSDWEGFAGGSGEYYVGVAADPFNDIAESDESDNSLNGEFIDYVKVNINVI